MTSRLDPLPNVAIDALLNKKPVFCFSKACGLEELYKEDKLLEQNLIVPYLRSDLMANKIKLLLDNTTRMEELAYVCNKNAEKWFDINKYIERIKDMGAEAIKEEKQAREERNYLLASKSHNFSYCFDIDAKNSKNNYIDHYLRTWKTGIGTRKPFPGFHPGIYKEYNMKTQDKEGLPLHSKRKPAVMDNKLITPSTSKASSYNKKVGIHIHVCYISLVEEIFKAISQNSVQMDIYITIDSLKNADILEQYAEVMI